MIRDGRRRRSRFWPRGRALVALGVFVPLWTLVGCDDRRPVPSDGNEPAAEGAWGAQAVSELHVQLDLVRRIGWLDARDSAGRLSDVEREYAGGVLGAVADVAVGSSDSLFVLDRQYQKIAVFGPDGSFARHVLGGAGSGPGEFEFPRAVALVGGDEIAVIDQQNGRLTRFSRAGEYISSFRTSQRDLDLEARNDTVFVTQHYQRPGHRVLKLYSLEGQDAGTRIDPSSGMLDLSLHGNPGVLEGTPDGTLLFASPEVGVWYENGSGPFVRHGAPLFADLEGRIDSRQRGNRTLHVRVVPAAVQGIVRTASDLTLIFFDVRYPEYLELDELAPGLWVAVYDADGSFSGRSLLFGDTIGAAYPQLAPETGHLYFAHWQPYPHIGQYEFTVDPGGPE